MLVNHRDKPKNHFSHIYVTKISIKVKEKEVKHKTKNILHGRNGGMDDAITQAKKCLEKKQTKRSERLNNITTTKKRRQTNICLYDTQNKTKITNPRNKKKQM